jgi:flagellar motor switch/type III secretory pathway protein FliN
MSRQLQTIAESWRDEFARAFSALTGESCASIRKISPWPKLQIEDRGEWFVQRFAGTSAAYWLLVPESSREILAHYSREKRLLDILAETSLGFVDLFEDDAIQPLSAESAAEPRDAELRGWLVEVELPSGPCTLGVAFNADAIGLVRPDRGNRKQQDNMAEMEHMLDMELPITVSIGTTQIPLRDVLKLTTGSIVELDRLISDPVDILVGTAGSTSSPRTPTPATCRCC